jgi:hypothetical protein
MKRLNLQDSYQVIHLILAGIILMVLLYSGIFPPEEGSHPIPSQYSRLSEGSTASTGMSRAFSAIVRLQFEQANQFNPNSLEVFAFFFIQLWLRLLFFILNSRGVKQKLLVIWDAGLSVVLFLYCFKDLIAAMYS